MKEEGLGFSLKDLYIRTDRSDSLFHETFKSFQFSDQSCGTAGI